MKKYLIILSAAFLALTGCMQFEPETVLDKDSVSTPSITVDAVKDQGFTVTISPASGTGFYSYAVVPGDAKEVSANTVFKLGVSGSLDKGTVNSADKSSITLTYDELDMNALYTVYAVAASELGCIGDVASTTIQTSDTKNPGIEGDPDITGTKVVITFSEDVKYTEGVSVKYYAINSKDILSNTPAGEVEDAKVSVSGPIVTIDCGTMPDGANYAISYPDGAFVDNVGNACPGMESGFEEKDGKPAGFGITGRKPTKAFDLDIFGGTPVTVVTKMADAIWLSIPEDCQIYGFDYSVPGSIKYETEEEGHSLVETFDIFGGAPTFGYGWNGSYKCALTYPNAGEAMTGRPDPARGSMVTLTIPSFLTDIYGNKNAEFVIGPFLYSYGFKTSDIIGTYKVSGKSAYGAEYDEDPWTFTIEESDDKELGDIMITSYYGFDDVAIYGEFDGDFGTAHFPIDFEPLGGFVEDDIYYDFYTFSYYSTSKEGGEGITFTMVKSGELADANDYPGYYYEMYAMPESGDLEDITDDDFINYDYNVFAPEFTTVAEAEAAPASFSSRYQVKMLDFGHKQHKTFTRQTVR